MAGNFWLSSHYKQWITTKDKLLKDRSIDLKVLSEEEYQKIMLFYANFIQAVGEGLKVRQQVITSAIIYFKRFYSRHGLKCIDPLLLGPTCIFLASKVEEFGVTSNSRLINTCQHLVRNKYSYALGSDFPYKSHNILEAEFYLLETLDACLIVYQPHRPLLYYLHDLGGEESLLPLAWRILNDSMRSDLPLLYAPHLIALAALHMAAVAVNKDCKNWFASLDLNLESIIEVTSHIIQLYDLWTNFDEKREIPEILAKMPKPITSRPPSLGP